MYRFKKTKTIIVIAVVISGLFLWRWSATSGLPSINWNVYNNTVHGYRVSYPSVVTIAPITEIDSRSLDKVDDLEFFLPGKITALFVTVSTQYANAPEAIATERATLISLPLRQFAETLRQYQITDKNPAVLGKQIGNLQETDFAGQKAYSFTLTKSFSLGLAGGYALADGTMYNYILTENKNGEKFIIHYPIGDSLSEQMKDSFVFTGR
jgi:hypothetical protein